MADIRHGILARSCFGAPEIFDPALGIARITLPLLSLALGEMRARGELADIDALLLHLEGIELRYFVEADPRWEEGAFSLAGRHLHVPLFKYDQDMVDMVRAQSWECSFIEEPNGGPD